LLREEPGVAHVTVEGGLKVDQHEADFVYLPTEVLARDAMGEFMRRRREKCDRQKRQDRRQVVQPRQVLGDVAPVRTGGGQRSDDDRAGGGQKLRRVAPPQRARESVEQAVRIGDGEAEVEEASPNAAPALVGGDRRRRGLEQARPAEMAQERRQALRRQRRPEARLRPLPDSLDRRLAVALLCDESFDLPETEEISRAGVLHDRNGPFGRGLLADQQIASQQRRSRDHAATGTTKAAGGSPAALLLLPTTSLPINHGGVNRRRGGDGGRGLHRRPRRCRWKC